MVRGVAGGTITAGELVYLTSSNTWALAQATTAPLATVAGVAMSNVASGQQLVILTSGPLNGGFTATVGGVYCCSYANGGGIAPIADIMGQTGALVTILGTASAAGVIQVNLSITGVVHA